MCALLLRVTGVLLLIMRSVKAFISSEELCTLNDHTSQRKSAVWNIHVLFAAVDCTAASKYLYRMYV